MVGPAGLLARLTPDWLMDEKPALSHDLLQRWLSAGKLFAESVARRGRIDRKTSHDGAVARHRAKFIYLIF